MIDNRIYNEISQKLILDDCATITKIIEYTKDKEYAPIFYMGIMPYFAMCAEGMLSFFKGQEEYDKISGEYNELIKNVRSKIKMYNEKIGKNITNIKAIHSNNNYYFADLCKFEFIKYLELYDDFGVYTTSNKHIGNTFLYNWYFENSLNIEDVNLRKETLFSIGKAVGMVINIISRKNVVKLNQVSILDLKSDIYYKDYLLSRNRTRIFNDKYDKYSTIILFNILCSINFVLYFLGKILPDDNTLYFRIKCNCYYYALFSLGKLVDYCEQNSNIEIGIENYKDKINQLGQIYRIIRGSNFRNCIAHYKITYDDLEENEIQLNIAFLGLIEKYIGKDYYSFNKEINNNLIIISNLLENWILK